MGFLNLFLGLVSVSFAAPVQVLDDEFITPPLLSQIASVGGTPFHGFNLTGRDGKRRHVVKDEVFEWGDRLDLKPEIAFEVILHEAAKWVGGGGFVGQLSPESIVDSKNPHDSLKIDRGWIRVWIKPDKNNRSFRIFTPLETLAVSDGEFWVQVRNGLIDMYVVRGQVHLTRRKEFVQKSEYVKLSGNNKTQKGQEPWDNQAVAVLIGGVYPAFTKLVDAAASDWENGKSTRLYAEVRTRGWRKAKARPTQ